MKRMAKTVAAILLLTSALGLSGCGNTAAESAAGVEEAGNIPENGSDTGGKEETVQGQSLQPDGAKEAEEPEQAADGAKEAEAPGQAADGAKEAEEPEQDAAGAEGNTGEAQGDLTGMVVSIEGNTFKISRLIAEEMENGLVGVGGAENDEAPLEAAWSDSTEFILRKMKDDNMTAVDTSADSSILKKDTLAEMEGSWDGDVFRADRIVVYSS